MSFSYGENIKLSVTGGSHDPEMSMRLSGFPKDFQPDMEALNAFLQRRAPGKEPYATKRKESDMPHFLSGLCDGKTTGEEIHAVIYNENQRSGDYKSLADVPRPSHADYPAIVKYGKTVDLRGGGHFSGRLTAMLCVAGGLSLQYLSKRGISVFAHAASIAGVQDTPFDLLTVGDAEKALLAARSFPTLSGEAERLMREKIEEARRDGDSVGGVITCAVTGLPVGLGEHMFGSVEARLSAAVFAVPGVKGISFGRGFSAALLRGSENNDPYVTDGKTVKTTKNDAGGVIGGMTSGMPLVFSVAIKPTPSIAKEQDSVSLSEMKNVRLTIGGRHDPVIVPRAVPVVEAVAALAVLDLLLDQ